MVWMSVGRHHRVRLFTVILLAISVLVAVACGAGDVRTSEQAVAPAIDVCSQVGTTGDPAPCQDAVSAARVRCAALSVQDQPTCGSELDALLPAAQEAAHLFH